MLDGQDYAIAWFDGNESTEGTGDTVAVLMSSYVSGRTDRLASSQKTFFSEDYISDEKYISEGSDAELYTQYFFSDDDVPIWHFSYQTGGYYYITTEVDGMLKYLTITNSALQLLDTPTTNSHIIIDNNGASGTNRENKLRFRNASGYAISRTNSSYTAGFGPNRSFIIQNNNDWFVLASPSADTKLKSIVNTAEKVSVSDTVSLHDGVNVVVYAKVYENGSYFSYAINGNGDLVKVWESGDVIQWKDGAAGADSLYWQFIQYGDSGYYEFYNPVTGMYLAPSEGQLLQNSTIGVTLSGRENGDYRSTIEAWDESVWSWYGYLYTDDLRLMPVPDTQALQMCFAVERPEEKFIPVETVDSKAAGITIKMYDYNTSYQRSIMGNYSYTAGGGATALVNSMLGSDGFPVMNNGTSLAPLFTASTNVPEYEANHLFIKSTYDETGYFEYSCFENSAFLMNANGTGATASEEGYGGVYDFTVYQELASPNSLSSAEYFRGNFLPFDQVSKTDDTAVNSYDSDSNELSSDDPRKGETIYVQNSADFYFGMSIEATFMIPENGCDENGNPLIFEFTGDDDFWLFIDDVLVLDLGGVHDALTGSVDFSTGRVMTYDGYTKDTYTVTSLMDSFREAGVFPDGSPWDESKVNTYFKDDGSFQSGEGIFKDYSSHTMKIFYMERGAGASNLKLRFNLATVSENSVFLEKRLTGTKTTDYCNNRYAYQLYYRTEGTDEFVLYENPDDPQMKAHYEGQNGLIDYSPTAVINGTAYENVFYLRADEKAEFTMPDHDTEYYFVELAVLNEQYDYVNINSQRAFTSDHDESGSLTYYDIPSETDTITNRKRVIYENHVDPDYLTKLVITKQVVDKDGHTVDNDKTGFEFQIGFLDENGNVVPYQKGEYYVVDDDWNYYAYINGKLSKIGKEKTVCSISGNNGSVAGISNGLSVVIEDLLPKTVFHVEELPSKMPPGYQWKSYERVTNEGGATYNLVEDGVINTGEIRENNDAHMIVVNQKGFGITVNKEWSDSEYTTSHDTICIALFHKENGELRYVADTFRELVSPNTSIYYFNDEEEAAEYVAMEVIPDSVQPADWNGDTSVVTDCQPYPPGGRVSLNAEDLNGEACIYDYTVGYEQGEIGGTGHNVRTDTISNSRDHLEIRKLSIEGTPLSGAVFTLTDITEGDVILKKFTSDKEGHVTDGYLNSGHSYKLTEVSAPKGYTVLSAPVVINVDESEKLDINVSPEDAENITTVLSADKKRGTLTIKDRPEGIIFRKTDTEGIPLKGGTFTIYKTDSAIVSKNLLAGHQNDISDENGVFFSGGLAGGYYLIEETKAPNGYVKPEISTFIHISADDHKPDSIYTVKYESRTGKYVKLENVLDKWLYKNDDVVRIDIPNEKAAGDIIIRKTIDGIDVSKGYPTFMFKATQTRDENGNIIRNGPEYICAVNFDSSDVEASKETQLSGLPIGTYMVEELSVINYTSVSLTVEGDDHAIISSASRATVTITPEDIVTVSFLDHLEENLPNDYTAFADNKISYTDEE